MMQELVCKHLKKNKKRYVFLHAASYKIGKALENDIVLLDADVLPVLATIENQNGTYVWKQGFQTVDLGKNTHTACGYSFHIRNDQKYFYGLIFAFLVLGLIFIFLEIQHRGSSVAMPDQSALKDDIPMNFVDGRLQGQSGREWFRSAQKFFHERNLRAGNLVRSQQMMVQAKQYYDTHLQQPPREFFELLGNIQAEKKKMIQDHRIVAERFRQQGYPEKSKKIYRKLLQELIDLADPDRVLIETEMKGILK